MVLFPDIWTVIRLYFRIESWKKLPWNIFFFEFSSFIHICFYINICDNAFFVFLGDAYMVASGLPSPNGKMHASEIARMSLDLREALVHFKMQSINQRMQIRIGINSGKFWNIFICLMWTTSFKCNQIQWLKRRTSITNEITLKFIFFFPSNTHIPASRHLQ